MSPLVSVICISYNHAPFIQEALESVFAQTYQEIEIIILDDCSKDNSRQEIERVIKGQSILFLNNEKNIGYPKTFNNGLALAKGKYIVDFALDDVMAPDFIQRSVAKLEKLGPSYGVSFTNADYIDQDSKLIGNHNEILRNKGLLKEVPEGNIFSDVLRLYFICTPTMMIRKALFDRMGAYDETLAYEDFDFWVRSSREYIYAYIDEVLMKKRKLQTSMSATRYRYLENLQMESVLEVCRKAFTLCKSKAEKKSLRKRLYYEHRQTIRHEAFHLSEGYLELLSFVGGSRLKATLMGYLIKLGIDRNVKKAKFRQ